MSQWAHSTGCFCRETSKVKIEAVLNLWRAVRQPAASLKTRLTSLRRQRRRCKDGGLIPIDPITPDVRQLCSKRAFDGQVRKWRRMLHRYDPASAGADCAATLRAPEPKVAAGDPADSPAVNPAPPAAAAPGDKRRCRAGSASAERAGSASVERAGTVPGCGKRARLAAEVALAARSIYGAWDEDDVTV